MSSSRTFFNKWNKRKTKKMKRSVANVRKKTRKRKELKKRERKKNVIIRENAIGNARASRRFTDKV